MFMFIYGSRIVVVVCNNDKDYIDLFKKIKMK